VKKILWNGLMASTLALSALACGDDSPQGGAGGTGAAGAGGTAGEGGSAGEGGTAGDGGSGGNGGMPDFDPGAGEACDVMAQNCEDPSAAKCYLDGSVDPVNVPSVCGELYGNDGEGDVCELPTGKLGQDTCAPGLFCTRHNTPFSQPQELSCLPLCDAHADCGDDRWCRRLNSDQNAEFGPDTRLVGFCVNPCESVWDESCQPGMRCLSGVTIEGERRYSCVNGSASKLTGEPCSSNNECAVGLTCGDDDTCTPLCDADHPCPLNTACDTVGDVLGFCEGPPANWACDVAQFADGVVCDCACGGDPDCDDDALPKEGCVGAEVCSEQGYCVPPEWTCAGNYYGVGDGCDCGCGVIDPDCADATVESCMFCQDVGSCGTGACPGNIDPLDNSTCQ
jgi:hypothetical protein